VKVAFDTSVLVAALVAEHPFHARAAPWMRATRDGTHAGIVALHALAETWATITALPLDPRVTGERAREMVWRLVDHVEVPRSSKAEYEEAMRLCAVAGVRSGAVYDALHYVAARNAGAKAFLTFEVRDFARFVAPGGPTVHAPPDPPSARLR
jgi:predicted nucleic acid-binding protein